MFLKGSLYKWTKFENPFLSGRAITLLITYFDIVNPAKEFGIHRFGECPSLSIFSLFWREVAQGRFEIKWDWGSKEPKLEMRSIHGAGGAESAEAKCRGSLPGAPTPHPGRHTWFKENLRNEWTVYWVDGSYSHVAASAGLWVRVWQRIIILRFSRVKRVSDSRWTAGPWAGSLRLEFLSWGNFRNRCLDQGLGCKDMCAWCRVSTNLNLGSDDIFKII